MTTGLLLRRSCVAHSHSRNLLIESQILIESQGEDIRGFLGIDQNVTLLSAFDYLLTVVDKFHCWYLIISST